MQIKQKTNKFFNTPTDCPVNFPYTIETNNRLTYQKPTLFFLRNKKMDSIRKLEEMKENCIENTTKIVKFYQIHRNENIVAHQM